MSQDTFAADLRFGPCIYVSMTENDLVEVARAMNREIGNAPDRYGIRSSNDWDLWQDLRFNCHVQFYARKWNAKKKRMGPEVQKYLIPMTFMGYRYGGLSDFSGAGAASYPHENARHQLSGTDADTLHYMWRSTAIDLDIPVAALTEKETDSISARLVCFRGVGRDRAIDYTGSTKPFVIDNVRFDPFDSYFFLHWNKCTRAMTLYSPKGVQWQVAILNKLETDETEKLKIDTGSDLVTDKEDVLYGWSESRRNCATFVLEDFYTTCCNGVLGILLGYIWSTEASMSSSSLEQNDVSLMQMCLAHPVLSKRIRTIVTHPHRLGFRSQMPILPFPATPGYRDASPLKLWNRAANTVKPQNGLKLSKPGKYVRAKWQTPIIMFHALSPTLLECINAGRSSSWTSDTSHCSPKSCITFQSDVAESSMGMSAWGTISYEFCGTRLFRFKGNGDEKLPDRKVCLATTDPPDLVSDDGGNLVRMDMWTSMNDYCEPERLPLSDRLDVVFKPTNHSGNFWTFRTKELLPVTLPPSLPFARQAQNDDYLNTTNKVASVYVKSSNGTGEGFVYDTKTTARQAGQYWTNLRTLSHVQFVHLPMRAPILLYQLDFEKV